MRESAKLPRLLNWLLAHARPHHTSPPTPPAHSYQQDRDAAMAGEATGHPEIWSSVCNHVDLKVSKDEAGDTPGSAKLAKDKKQVRARARCVCTAGAPRPVRHACARIPPPRTLPRATTHNLPARSVPAPGRARDAAWAQRHVADALAPHPAEERLTDRD